MQVTQGELNQLFDPILKEKRELERQLKERTEALIQVAEIFQKIQNAVTDYSIGWAAGCEIARDWATAGLAQKQVAEVTADYHEWRKWQTTCHCGGCFKANSDLLASNQKLQAAATAIINNIEPDDAGCDCATMPAALYNELAEALGINTDDVPRS